MARKVKTTKTKINRYDYYEASVQTPEEHVKIYDQMYRYARKKEARVLREDFCGTFLISCEWVKSHPNRKAIGLDLDPEPILYGKKNNLSRLSLLQKKRVRVLQQNVLKPTTAQPDIIGVGNFSFNIFKTKPELLAYFKAALKSLHPEGLLALELAGGPGFIKTGREQRTYKTKKLGRFTYYWDQKKYDPIQAHGLYAIHFKTEQGGWYKDAFVYDWRVWTIPELKEIMLEAGFKKVQVYWEEADATTGEGNGSWVPMESGDNAFSWIAFVVGLK